MKQRSIKFLAGCQPACRFHLNPVYYFLKSFYKKNGKHFDRYRWLDTEYHLEFPDRVARRIPPNLYAICASMFIWNWDIQAKLIQDAKKINPNLKVILGGPEVDAQNEPDFFEKNPWVDYVIYGDGEVAFQMLLDSFYEKDFDLTTIPNLITKDFKNKHEVFKFKNYPPYNAFLDLKDDFLKDVESVRNYLEHDDWFVNYERVRGCPYDCAFCNWSSGLHHKVNVRDSDWKSEIDLFADLNLKVKFNDANFGIYKEDMEVLDYVIEARQKRQNNFVMFPRNFAKMQKQIGFEMMDKISSVEPSLEIKISLQDIDDVILKNIYRPDILWEEHKKLIIQHRQKHPESQIILELIAGLPGSTIESIENQYMEYCDIPASFLYCYEWVLLKNSPAYSELYQNKYNLEKVKIFTVSGEIPLTEEQLTEKLDSNDTISVFGNFEYMVYDKTLGLKGVLYQFYLNELYILLFNKHRNEMSRSILQSAIDKIKDDLWSHINKQVENMKKMHEEKGYLILSEYIEDKGKYLYYPWSIQAVLTKMLEENDK